MVLGIQLVSCKEPFLRCNVERNEARYVIAHAFCDKEEKKEKKKAGNHQGADARATRYWYVRPVSFQESPTLSPIPRSRLPTWQSPHPLGSEK
jgi:hypothetical protein